MNCNTENEDRRRVEWSNSMTKLLIFSYKDLAPKVGKTKEFTTYNKLYERIAEIMGMSGYKVTSAQVKQKWDSLARAFKETTISNQQTGQKRKICPYQDELYDIFKSKRSVYPEIVIDDNVVRRPNETIEDSLANDNELLMEEQTENTRTEKQKKRFRPSANETLFKQRERHHKEKMDYLKSYMDFKKENEEAKKTDRRELLNILNNKNV